MSKRLESGASKRKRLENAMTMKLRPITAFMHKPLIEATRVSSEAIRSEPTTSIQPDKNLPERETVKQDVEQQADYEEAAMMLAQTENIELIQKSLTGQGEAKEPQEKNVNSQILQFTPDMIVGQVQGVPDADKDGAKHRPTIPDVGLRPELSHEEVSY
ncbi:Hypothetical predicted protein [Podarcis lilfordi]|uniref:Uncharacterized protein n=1 Tax=Podarcis lilfordi TaxID=74358 RepID=A0AA35LDD5_9SAUR|nr:Hypothetical predicted protein [Podarcis lilfordi]